MFKKIFFVQTRRERIIFVTAFVAAIISGTILFGLELIKSTRTVPASGGAYTEGFLGQPIYANPVIAASEIDKTIVRLVFSNLNDLADKIEPAPDGKTWKIRLRENLRWQDGEKLTSDDIIFTVQKIQDRETASPLSNAWQGVAAQRLSELEFQFSLINPYAFFSDTLKNLYILPKHLFADTPPSNWRLSDYNLNPIGSGPYKFFSYDKRADGFIKSYELRAWDKYFGEVALIEKFSFQFFAKFDDLIKSFNSGQVDGVIGLEPENLTQIKRPYEIFPFRLSNYYAVFLNQSKSVPLKDAAVRNALNLLADRANLITAALGGHGRSASGPIPEGNPLFGQINQEPTSSMEQITEDASTTTPPAGRLDLVSSTLNAAGWKMNEDGVREKTIGSTKIPLELNLVVPQINFLQKTAELLRNTWQKAGIKINLIIQLPEEIRRSTVKNRDYEMLLFGNVLGRGSDLFSFWHSSERFHPGLNLALYNNKKADTLIESIRQNLDNEKRLEQFNDLQKLIMGDVPAIFLYSPDYIYIADKNLRGLEAGEIAEPADIFTATNKWYLKTARVLK
ncbi:MAG: peptide ABC transporter substrate-binding protein [bacterium]|nr:peptide ABC transporter substrate-binding protein [bacterium]